MANDSDKKQDTKIEPLGLELGEGFANKHPKVTKDLSIHQLIYSLGGLALGFVCVVGGVVLFLNGVIGSSGWTAKLLGAESSINDAAPGAVLFIVGLFIVFTTRYVFKIHK